jgi:cardiolipin synthase A/B
MDKTWTEERLFFDGDEYFDDLLEGVAQAQVSIELETYIFSADPLGRRVEEALSAAAGRGVNVRLLVDGIGGLGWFDKQSQELKASTVKVRVYHPVLISGFFKNRRRGTLFSRMNRRDHRKVCLIDGETDKAVAWVGSLNIAGSHCRSILGQDAWRDTGVRLRGEGLKDLLIAFNNAWARSHTADGKRRWRESLQISSFASGRVFGERLKSPVVRLNYTRRLRRKNAFQLRTRLRSARQRIWITTAYFAPTPNLVRRLTNAAKRGVDVRILVPRKSDVFFMPWVTTAHYAPLLVEKVRIFEYLPRFLHAKSVIVDDWVTVGTTNLNQRSLLYDFEVDIVIKNEASLQLIDEQFLKDLAQSEEVKVAPGGLASFLGRLINFFWRRWI